MILSRPLFPVAAGVLLASSTGCGVMSAMANPKAAWALQEPAPMAVILRRADVARATATNVDRLLSTTGVDASSKWVAKIALKKADAEAALKDIGADPDYVVPKGAKIGVVQAEAWAKLLADLCPHESKFPNLIATVSTEVATDYADIAGQAKKLAKLKADKAAEETALDAKDISASDKEEHEKKKTEIPSRSTRPRPSTNPRWRPSSPRSRPSPARRRPRRRSSSRRPWSRSSAPSTTPRSPTPWP